MIGQNTTHNVMSPIRAAKNAVWQAHFRYRHMCLARGGRALVCEEVLAG
jgi:hypothetical protein